MKLEVLSCNLSEDLDFEINKVGNVKTYTIRDNNEKEEVSLSRCELKKLYFEIGQELLR